jgi:LuxR family transcriptional regulator, maltose regulon positive regulatory protein
MPTELLTSKLFIPPLRPSLVPRPRLIQLLNEGLYTKRKLTLVSAPAGFGKTTLVVDWLRQVDRPAAWLSLDEAVNNLPRFMAYLGAAFQQVDEQIGASLESALQSPQPPDVQRLLTGLLNEIAARTDPLILVLDDLHLLNEAGILEGIAFLLHQQPPQLHLILTTREDPDMPLARLRARDQMTEIRARDLRFTQEETDAFLRGVMGLALSEQDVAALEGRTEGWAAGLQLAGLSMQKQADLKSFIADFSGSHRHILDYLTGEVLQQQTEDVRTFLLQTSVLSRLSGPLCDALTGRTDGSRVLAHLDSANLFVIALDEERLWYRYHHLFSDLLRSQLTRSQPEWIPELHRRASRWYAEHGDIQDAIDHALQDTDLTQAVQLIEQHAIPKLYRGQVAMVIGWFDRLPEAVFEAAPMLCISKAWAFVVMQRITRPGEVERSLHAADRALARGNAGEALRALVAGHAASIRAFSMQTSALLGKKPEALIALSQEAQRLLPVEEKAIRSVNALNTGYGYLALANLEAAQLAYKQALEDGLAGGNFYAAIYGPINLVVSTLLMGRWREALQLCDTNIERFNRILAGQYFPPIGALYVLKGSILLEHNRLAEAEQPLIEGLDLIRWTGETMAHRKGYQALARLRAIQGDRPAMSEAVKTLEETFPEGAFYAQAMRHRLSIRHWPGDLYMQEDAQIWLDQCGIDFGELAVIDRVDDLSTDYFEGYLNAARVLAYLAKKMPGAYPVEDVHAYLRRQAEFAETHGILSWVVEIAIAQTLLYQAAGKIDEALETLEGALRAAAHTGLFRVFVDEGAILQALLAQLKPRLRDEALIAYASRLLEALSGGPAKPETEDRHKGLLSERELEVLQYLAMGLSYEEIGRQLFLSLNTIQFHVKNIYRKLSVNKRAHAIEKAREMNLI